MVKSESDYNDSNDKDSNNKTPWWQPAVMLFVRMSFWIAIPVVLATFIGNWIDKRINTAPWGLLSVVGVAFSISMVGLVLEATKEYKKINKEKPKKESNTKTHY